MRFFYASADILPYCWLVSFFSLFVIEQSQQQLRPLPGAKMKIFQRFPCRELEVISVWMFPE